MTIHFTLPEGFSGTVTVDKGGKVTINGIIASAAVAGTTALADTSGLTPPQASALAAWPQIDPLVAVALEDLLGRQKSHTPESRSREVAQEMIKRGWHAHPDKAGRYFRFVYPGSSRKVTLYMSSIELNNIRKQDRDFMLSLPGVNVRKNDVRLPFNGPEFDKAVENVEALEVWADTK